MLYEISLLQVFKINVLIFNSTNIDFKVFKIHDYLKFLSKYMWKEVNKIQPSPIPVSFFKLYILTFRKRAKYKNQKKSQNFKGKIYDF